MIKKYLLTALLWVFGFVGAFASADNITTITSDWSSYIPTTITFNSDYVITEGIVSSVSCDSECNITIINPSVNNYDCSIDYYWAGTDDDGSFEWYIPNNHNQCNFTAWTYDVYKQEWTNYFNSISFVVPSSDSWNWGLVENWTWTFSWIITSLWTTVSEFIPYVVYLWVWILGALIWFVAVKRLMNRIRRKVLWTFSNWRRR